MTDMKRRLAPALETKSADTVTHQTPTNRQLPARRWIYAAIPAAFLTGALGLGMASLIDTKDIQLSDTDYRVLSEFVPEERVEKPRTSERQPAERVEVTPPPPQQAQRLDNPGDVTVTTIGWTPPAVETPSGRVEPIRLGGGSMIIRETAVAITTVEPVYPRAALNGNKEGACEVVFAIDPTGAPFNLTASCTDDVFKRESIRAVRKARFAPVVLDGQARGQTNLVYPIEYRLN